MRFSTLSIVAISVATSCLAGAAKAEDEHRQLGPHLHGHGTLSIAIEGDEIMMELRAPGMDIVGFEHEASGPEQKALVETASKDLQDNVLGLFVLPEAAACRLTSSKVEIVAEEHHDDEAGTSDTGGNETAEEGGEHHSEFVATYGLTCADAAKLTSIDFAFFGRFPGSQELDVTIIDGDGQNAYEVSRESGRLERPAR